MNSFQLLEAKWKFKLDVAGSVGIMSQLQVIVEAMLAVRKAKGAMPFHAGIFPFVVPLHFCSRFYEELHLHLLKLAHAEDELARNDFVTKCFSGLRNAER